MPSRVRQVWLAATAALAPFVLSAQQLHEPTCYDLTYDSIAAAIPRAMLPPHIKLLPGDSLGRASATRPQSTYILSGYWQRFPTYVFVMLGGGEFDLGFSFNQRGDTLSGSVDFQEDAIRPGPIPRARVVATRQPCAE